MSTEVRLGFACAGTPTPAVERYGTACVLEIGERPILIDCGPAATYKLTRLGVQVTDISEILFTHHHFDHDADYPCFVLSRWDQLVDHSTPLRVWGPEPTRRLTEDLFGEDGVYARDWRARVEGPASQEVFVRRGGTLPRPPLRVCAGDIAPGSTLSLPGCEIRAHAACHLQPWLKSLCYRAETPAGVLCLVGDSGPCPSVTEAARHADVVVVNCWDHKNHDPDNPLSCCLFNVREAALLARQAESPCLILTHLTAAQAAPGNRDTLLAAVRDAAYTGRCIVAEEGDWIACP